MVSIVAQRQPHEKAPRALGHEKEEMLMWLAMIGIFSFVMACLASFGLGLYLGERNEWRRNCRKAWDRHDLRDY